MDFNFINRDILEYNSNCKYDNIFLSNLCTVLDIHQLLLLLTKLKNNNLNINGSMLISYLWETTYLDSEINFNWIPMYNMPITRNIFGEFITFHQNINGIRDIVFDRNNKSDLIMIYKNRIK